MHDAPPPVLGYRRAWACSQFQWPHSEQAARWRIDLEAAAGERVLQRDDEVFDLTDHDDSLDPELTIFGIGGDVGESSNVHRLHVHRSAESFRPV